MATTTLQNYNKLRTEMLSTNVKERFEQVLGTKANSFISNVLTTVSNNESLKNCEANSIMTSAMIAATLDLSINPNLGQAAIVPYKDRDRGDVATFQIMTNGFKQLAIRSGQYAKINNAIVYEGQLIKEDPFTDDYVFDHSAKKSDKVIGYMAYFRLNTGFEKYYYMSVSDVDKHAKKFSKTYQKGFGVWKDNFDAMGLKTVLKMLLNKYGILSIDMQKAILFDQAVVKGSVAENNVEEMEVEYVDNKPSSLADKLNEE